MSDDTGGITQRKLEMRFAGGLVQHLGLQMYAGAVPAIAELISNAWDADATEVRIDVPLDRAISDDLKIRVADNGSGMTFDEVNGAYLVVGRNRRTASGTLSAGGRPVLGRKGIGKLAGFGIAQEVEVWTVRDGWLTAFSMRYEDITRQGQAEMSEPYEPTVIADRAVEPTDPIQTGTLIVLRHLQVRNAVAGDRFLRGMARRFSLLSTNFKVLINGTPLSRAEMDFQFRFPESGMDEATVPGLGTIRWWAGFTERPIAVEEARGISVLARGKLVQAPFFFAMTRGTQGQHGLQYLTGEVHADALDDASDLIATDRASVLWEDSRAAPLLDWGQAKVRELLREWSDQRRIANRKRLRDTTPFMAMIDRFPERERQELEAAIETLAGIETIEDDRLSELVGILIRAYENDSFMNLIRALNSADVAAYEALAELFNEWDVIEAVRAAQQVRGRVEVIRRFGDLIAAGAPEKPDMQDFVKKHPWLLDIRLEMMQHERSLDRVIAENFSLDVPTEEEERNGLRRLDFFCLGDSGAGVVVELKRPGTLVGLDELRQLEDYVYYLRTWNHQSTGNQQQRSRIEGCFVYGRLRPDAIPLRDRLTRDGIDVVQWTQLLETAERTHREFLEIVSSRAPQDDPRIQALADLDSDTDDGSTEPPSAG